MSKRKLLLADDSITIQKVVNLTFADEGVDVISVSDGNSAIDKLREEMPDLVMADVNMPGLNGYEICEKIKQSEFGNADTPVILLVGSFEPFDEDEAKRVGADDYLTKPFQSISQLVEKVSYLLKLEKDESFEDTAEMFLDRGKNDLDKESETFIQDDSEIVPESLPNDFSDDEMIQTAQVGRLPIDDAVKYETAPEIPIVDTDDEDILNQSKSHVNLPDFHQTQPFTLDDYQEIDVDDQEAKVNIEYVENRDSESKDSIENELLVLAENENNHTDTDSIDFQEVNESGLTGFQGESESDDNNSIIPMPEAASILELDELNLLDLPPLDLLEEPKSETKSIESDDSETQSLEQDNVAEPKSVVEDYSDFTKGINEDVSQDTVNAIAKQVVERISEKVINEIAWEVVPELAELIINKIAKEKMKN